MKLLRVERTPNQSKAFRAIFKMDNDKEKRVTFGTSSNYVLNPDKTKQDRENYLKRHKTREDWEDPLTAGSLSKHILWGESRNLNTNIRAFKKKFKL